MIDLASNMQSEGQSSAQVPRDANPDSPITAFRYQLLCAYNGDDDMLSSDFSEDQLKQKLGHMSTTPTLVSFSSVRYYSDNSEEFASSLLFDASFEGYEVMYGIAVVKSETRIRTWKASETRIRTWEASIVFVLLIFLLRSHNLKRRK